jgi:adenylylsulfate kinase
VTGLPAAGKSTFAHRLRARLERDGRASLILDGDEVRRALVPAPGYGARARARFYATLARLAALVAEQGFVAIVAATAHLGAYRRLARTISPAFLEVYLDADARSCAQRDRKGLYAMARAGKLSSFPGAAHAYEPPECPDVTGHGGRDSAAVGRALAVIHHHEPAA